MFPLRSYLWMLSRKGDSMTDGQGETPARRDGRGRYLRGASGNPAGKPRGCLNHATRIAAEMLGGEAETLWRGGKKPAPAGQKTPLMPLTPPATRAPPAHPPPLPVPPAGEKGGPG